MTETVARGDPRHRGREAALQMLYAWEVGKLAAADVAPAFWPAHGVELELPEPARALADRLVAGTIAELDAIDPIIANAIDNWRPARLAVIDRLILRLAVFELRYEPDTPPAVVINEALELARTFSSDDSVRFVNGVLDAIRKRIEDSGSG